jgi:hypothetical protein
MTGITGTGAASPAPGTPNSPTTQAANAPTNGAERTSTAVDRLRAFAAGQPNGATAASSGSAHAGAAATIPPAPQELTTNPATQPSPALRDAIHGALATKDPVPAASPAPGATPVVTPAAGSDITVVPAPAPVSTPRGAVTLPPGAHPVASGDKEHARDEPTSGDTKPTGKDKPARAQDKDRQPAPAPGGTRRQADAPPPPEPPRVDPPKVETPQVEPTKAESPKTESPKVDVPNIDVPKAETPKVDAPNAHIDAPATESPSSPSMSTDESTGAASHPKAVRTLTTSKSLAEARRDEDPAPALATEPPPPTPSADRARELMAGEAPDTPEEQRWVTRTREDLRQLAPHINDLVDTMNGELVAGRDGSKVADAIPAAVKAATTAGYSIKPERRTALLNGEQPATAEEQVFVGGISLVIQQMLATVKQLIAAKQAELRAGPGAATGGGALAPSFVSPMSVDSPGDPATGIDELPLRASVVDS